MIPYELDHQGFVKLVKTSQQSRAERFALKSVANRLLPDSRTSKCMVLRAPLPGCGLAPIQVHKALEHNKAFYTGLMACGSVWHCPVCSSKVSERRRTELQCALMAAAALGWKVHFVTLTVPHGVGDDLAVIRSLQQKALQRMNSGKNRLKNLFEREGVECHGFIRAYEITHGKAHGFHPHFHILLFHFAEYYSFPGARDLWQCLAASLRKCRPSSPLRKTWLHRSGRHQSGQVRYQVGN